MLLKVSGQITAAMRRTVSRSAAAAASTNFKDGSFIFTFKLFAAVSGFNFLQSKGTAGHEGMFQVMDAMETEVSVISGFLKGDLLHLFPPQQCRQAVGGGAVFYLW